MGEDQTVHNLLTGEDQTVHNLLTGEDQTVHKSFLRWRVTTHNLLTGEDQTVSTNNMLYTIMLSQRVVVHNFLTLIVYQRFDQYGSRSI